MPPNFFFILTFSVHNYLVSVYSSRQSVRGYFRSKRVFLFPRVCPPQRKKDQSQVCKGKTGGCDNVTLDLIQLSQCGSWVCYKGLFYLLLKRVPEILKGPLLLTGLQFCSQGKGRIESGEEGTHKAVGCERDQGAHLSENYSSRIL